jgi:hypothetical protein
MWGLTQHPWIEPELFEDPGVPGLMHLWGVINLGILGAAILACFDPRERRHQERFPVDLLATCEFGSLRRRCRLRDLSLSGARVDIDESLPVSAGGTLSIPVIGELPAHVVWAASGSIGLSFDRLPADVRHRLIRILYTSGLDQTPMLVHLVRLLRECVR